MTLSEFKELSPDGTYKSSGCTDDQNDGVVRCEWSNIEIAHYSSGLGTYRFIKPSNSSDPKLFEIFISLPSHGFQDVFDGLSKKFGKPKKIKKDEVQNRIGNRFENYRVEWNNGISSIEIAQRFSSIDIMSIRYEHIKLSRHYYREAEKKSAPPSEKF